MNDLTHSTAYGELGPTLPSTYTAPRPQPRSAKIARLIAELGLRFRPTAQADLEAHAAMLGLLIRDVSHVNPDALEKAINEHVRCSRFMPKTAELLELVAKHHLNTQPIITARPAPYNQKDIQDRDRRQFTAADWQELNERLEGLGSSARYHDSGTRYTI